jgi:hypothetical protein
VRATPTKFTAVDLTPDSLETLSTQTRFSRLPLTFVAGVNSDELGHPWVTATSGPLLPQRHNLYTYRTAHGQAVPDCCVDVEMVVVEEHDPISRHTNNVSRCLESCRYGLERSSRVRIRGEPTVF